MSIPAKVKSAIGKRINHFNDVKVDFILHFIVVRPNGIEDAPLLHFAPKPEGSTLAAFREVYKSSPAVAKAPPAKMIVVRGVITQQDGVLRIHPAIDSKFTASTQVKKAFTDLKKGISEEGLNTAWILRLEQGKTLVTPPVDPRKIGVGTDEDEDVDATNAQDRVQDVDEVPDEPGFIPVQPHEDVDHEVEALLKRINDTGLIRSATELRDAGEEWSEKVRAAARFNLMKALETLLPPILLDVERAHDQILERRRVAQEPEGPTGYEPVLTRIQQVQRYVQLVIDRVELQLQPAPVDEEHRGVEAIGDEGTKDPKLAALVEAVQKLDIRGALQAYDTAFDPQTKAKPPVQARARTRLLGVRNALQRIEGAVGKHAASLKAERDGAIRHAGKLTNCEELASRLDGMVLQIEERLGEVEGPELPRLFDIAEINGPSRDALDEARFQPVKDFYTRYNTLVTTARRVIDEQSKPAARAELARGLASRAMEVKQQADAQLQKLKDAVEAVLEAAKQIPAQGQGPSELWLAAHDLGIPNDQRTIGERIEQDYVPRRTGGGYALFQTTHNAARKEPEGLKKRADELIATAESVTLYRDLEAEPTKSDARNRLVEMANENPAALKAMGKTATGARLLDALVANLGETVAKGDIPFLQAAFAARFDMKLGGEDLTRRATPLMYKLFAKVPEAHTRDNANIQSVMRTRKKSGGGDYGGKKINIEVARSGFRAPTVTLKVSSRQQKKANFFNHTVLHEIGHGVDEDLKFMDTHMGEATYGAWSVSSPVKIADRLYDENKGDDAIKDLDATAVKAYFVALLEGTAEKPKDVDDPSHLPTLLKGHALTEACKLIAPTEKKGLWFAGEKAIAKVEAALKGQVAVHSYAEDWHMYDADARKRILRDYQFRAPGEWFAEIYAAYYMGLLNSTDKAWFEKEIHNPAQGQG